MLGHCPAECCDPPEKIVGPEPEFLPSPGVAKESFAVRRATDGEANRRLSIMFAPACKRRIDGSAANFQSLRDGGRPVPAAVMTFAGSMLALRPL